MLRLFVCLAAAALLALPAVAPAQGVVVTTYSAPPVVVAPPPVVTTTYYVPAPVVTAYAAPAVTYYSAPAVVRYRQPLLRPFATVVRTRPAFMPAVPVMVGP